jgi:predicted small metal-binding protein
MSADKALRCDCGYEVRPDDEGGHVEAVRRHAREAHGIDFSIELALDVIRRAGVVPSSEPSEQERRREEKQ